MSWLTAMERRRLAAIEPGVRLAGNGGNGEGERRISALLPGASLDAADLKGRLAEVEEQAHAEACGLEVGGQLGAVCAADVCDRLELDDHLVRNNKIEPVRADLHPPVGNANQLLGDMLDPAGLQLDQKSPFVHRLHEARPKRRVNSNRGRNHRSGDVLVFELSHESPARQLSPSPVPPFPAPLSPTLGTPRSRFQAGFTLLEVMMALLLLATAVTILVQSQTTAVHLQEQATRINTATMLARQIFTELDIRMAKEGFGELEVKEQGDFNDNIYDGAFDDYRWEYEVEKLEVELPNLGNLMGMLGEGTDELGDAAGVSTGGQAPQSDLAALGALGFDFSFLTEQMGKYLREARVRICWIEGKDRSGQDQEECLEVVTHMANPTGRVLSAEEQLALDNYEDAGGDVDALMDQLNGGGGGGGNPGAPLGGLGGR